MKKIYVWMPSGSGFPYPEVMLNVMQQEMPDGYEIYFSIDNIVCGSVVHTARNRIVAKFLQSDCDYLWFCDDDNPPSSDVLKYLIEADKDVASALVPLRHWGYMLNLIKDKVNVTSIADYDDLFEVDNIWTGCVLMTRKVVEDVYNATEGLPYQFAIKPFVFNIITDKKELYTNQDTEIWREDKYLSNDWKILKRQWEVWEDLMFWLKAKELWYRFFADKRARCTHYKNKPEALTVNNT